MLMPVKPETLKTLEEIQKLEFLRDVVIPFVKEREKEGKVNLDNVRHKCGTPSCLYGWALTYAEFKSLPNDYVSESRIRRIGFFGITELECRSLFGVSCQAGSLDDRAEACTRIINRKLGEL